MHDDPTAHRPARAGLRFPVRTAVAAGAAAVLVALAAARGTGTTASTPPAPPAPPAPAAADQRGESSDDPPESRALTPFDTRHPAVGRLDAHLLKAVQRAARDARRDGVEFRITSGRRSAEHQQRLLDEATEKYGSAEVARQYVNTPGKSAHVSGKAVDIGPTDADDWLVRHGSDYGLCQVYTNEMWHFELLTAPGGQCPAQLRNAAG